MTSHTHAQAVSDTMAVPVRSLQRACDCGAPAGISGQCPSCAADERLGVQPKLRINPPGDRWEREADRVADQVVSNRHPALAGPLSVTPLVQRQPAEQDEEEEPLQAKPAGPLPVTPLVQRQPAEQEEDEEALQTKSKTARPSKPGQRAARFAADALSGGGRPLSRAERGFFEPRFGRDFSAVRVHDGARAGAAALGIQARAFTLGRNIAFAPNAFDTRTQAGRRLIAHELTHTIQQTGGGGPYASGAVAGRISRAPASVIQRDYKDLIIDGKLVSFTGPRGANAKIKKLQRANPDARYRIVERDGDYVIQIDEAPSGETEASGGKRRAKVCNRDNTQVSDFPKTYIKQIDIDLGNHASGMSLTWNRATSETKKLPRTFKISPGAGLCSVCCNDTAASRKGGSLCTPKGTSKINRYACRLGSTAWARDASYFEGGDSRGGVAIHTGKRGYVPVFPASHGCIRTTNKGAAVVLDNSANGTGEKVQTAVVVSGTWNGSRCYPSAAGRRRLRRKKERCGGKPAPAKPEAASGKKASVAPIAAPGEGEAPKALAIGPEPKDLAGPA